MSDETTAGPASAGPPPTPELDRQSQAIKDGAHKIGQFLDWAESKGMHLCEWHDGIGGGRWYERSNFQQIVADFYGIDLNKIAAERQTLLDYIREQQS